MAERGHARGLASLPSGRPLAPAGRPRRALRTSPRRTAGFLGGLRDPGLNLGRELGFATEVFDQACALTVGERLEQYGGGVQLAASPARPSVEELWLGHAEEQAAHPATARRSPRRGRGKSFRPSGCRRRRLPANAETPRPRRASGLLASSHRLPPPLWPIRSSRPGAERACPARRSLRAAQRAGAAFAAVSASSRPARSLTTSTMGQ